MVVVPVVDRALNAAKRDIGVTRVRMDQRAMEEEVDQRALEEEAVVHEDQSEGGGEGLVPRLRPRLSRREGGGRRSHRLLLLMGGSMKRNHVK